MLKQFPRSLDYDSMENKFEMDGETFCVHWSVAFKLQTFKLSKILSSVTKQLDEGSPNINKINK